MQSDLSSRRERALAVAPHLCFGLLAAGLLGLAELSLRRFQSLMQEDGWAEWSTFAAFALAAALGLRRARAAPVRWERWLLLGLGAFCLFVAGEEISWGQRLFGYRPPQFFLEHNFQQEANLHNLLKELLDTRYVVLAIALGYGVLAPVVGYVFALPPALTPARTLIPYFALVAWLEFAYPFELVGELAELLLGLAFLFDLAQRAALADEARAARVATLAQLGALAAGALLLPLNDAVVGLHAVQFTRSGAQELAQLAQRLGAGEALRARLFRKPNVHKRVYTAARAGYLTLPPDEYALDPWNNPYWLAYRKQSDTKGALLLYSFGPNHRRETDVDAFGQDSFQFAGDDFGVQVEVQAPETTQQAQR